MGGKSAARVWSQSRDGLVLRVRVTPRAGRERVAGVVPVAGGMALRLAVTAPPEGGKANAAAIKALARALKVPRAKLTITSGASSRTKSVRIEGDASDLAAKITALVSETRT